MSFLDWQLLIVVACIAGAAWSIGRRGWHLLRAVSRPGGTSSCGTCHTCAVGRDHIAAPQGTQLVPLQIPRRSPDRPRE